MAYKPFLTPLPTKKKIAQNYLPGLRVYRYYTDLSQRVWD